MHPPHQSLQARPQNRRQKTVHGNGKGVRAGCACMRAGLTTCRIVGGATEESWPLTGTMVVHTGIHGNSVEEVERHFVFAHQLTCCTITTRITTQPDSAVGWCPIVRIINAHHVIIFRRLFVARKIGWPCGTKCMRIRTTYKLTACHGIVLA